MWKEIIQWNFFYWKLLNPIQHLLNCRIGASSGLKDESLGSAWPCASSLMRCDRKKKKNKLLSRWGIKPTATSWSGPRGANKKAHFTHFKIENLEGQHLVLAPWRSNCEAFPFSPACKCLYCPEWVENPVIQLSHEPNMLLIILKG